MSLRKSSIVSGAKAIQTYEREGLEIATEPIKEYVRLIGYDVDKTPRTVKIPETLRLISMVGTIDGQNRITGKVFNRDNSFLYAVEINTPYFTYNNLIVEGESTIEFSSNNAVSYFAIFAVQCQVLYDITT